MAQIITYCVISLIKMSNWGFSTDKLEEISNNQPEKGL